MNFRLRHITAAAGLTGALIAGGIGVASAQSVTTVPATPATAAAPKADRSARLAATLAPLVADKTLTQAQADAVVKALAAADLGGGHGGGRGGFGGFGNHAATVASALGISTTDLETALQSGKTIAQIAKDKGVDVQKVIAALVAEEKTEHPTATDADITTRVTAMVNGLRPAGGRGRGAVAPTAVPTVSATATA